MENLKKVVREEPSDVKVVDNTEDFKIYSIYDSVLGTFGTLFSLNDVQLDKYLKSIVNDIQSPYYGHELDYVLYHVGDFELETGEVFGISHKKISTLDKYIDGPTRNLQTIVKCLNYLPQGYFKMPEEMKKSIQEKIDESIKAYVENYVIPDIDMSKYSASEHQSQTLNS